MVVAGDAFDRGSLDPGDQLAKRRFLRWGEVIGEAVGGTRHGRRSGRCRSCLRYGP